MAQAIIGAVATVIIVLLGINYAEGNFCWTETCQAAWQAKISAQQARATAASSAATAAGPTWTTMTPPPSTSDDGIVEAGYRGGHRPHAARRDPKFDYFRERCIEQIEVRKRQDPNVEVRVEGGPGRRSTCYVGSTSSEEGYVAPD